MKKASPAAWTELKAHELTLLARHFCKRRAKPMWNFPRCRIQFYYTNLPNIKNGPSSTP